jgi:molybdopterin converting factor small subunit
VKLFAAAREAAGAGEVVLDVADGATLADVEQTLLEEVPGLTQIVSHSRWALDAEFCGRTATVSADSEIALIPPVSGG